MDPPGEDPKLWVVYNFKGGVGKTTTVINVAMALRAATHPDNPTDTGPNILMVDADPQCNLTAFFNREKQDDADEANNVDDGDDDTDEDDKFEGHIQCDSISPEAEADTQESLKQEANNIYTGLQPVLQNKANEMGHFDDKSLVHVRPADGNNGNVWLLPGSPRFGKFEQKIPSLANFDTGNMPIFGAFRRFVCGTALAVKASVVLIDVGPSRGALNQCITMSSDFIIPPTTIGLLAYESTGQLYKTILPDFFKFRASIVEKQEAMAQGPEAIDQDMADTFFIPHDPPCIWPLLISCYNVSDKRTKSRPSTVVKEHEGMIASYQELVEDAKKNVLLQDFFVAIPATPRKQNLYNAYIIPIMPSIPLKIVHGCEMARMSVVEVKTETLKKSVHLTTNRKKALEFGRLARRRWLSFARTALSNMDSS